jgi:hypothetical protein
MVNLTTLAPDIVEAILEDALPDHLTLFDLAVDPPALWEEQRLILVSTKDDEGLQLLRGSQVSKDTNQLAG